MVDRVIEVRQGILGEVTTRLRAWKILGGLQEQLMKLSLF